MKKLLALLTMFVLTASLLAGCTPDELSFLQLNQEINTLDTYTMEGSLNWDADLEALLKESDDIDPELLESQREFIRVVDAEGLRNITFTYRIDLKNNAMNAQYSAGNNALFNLIMIKDTYYVNFDGLLELVKRNDTQALQETEEYGKLEALKGKYLMFSTQDLIASGLSSSKLLGPAQLQNSLVRQQALGKNIMNYFIDFAKTELSGYSPGLLKKTYDSSLGADVYGYSVKVDQMPLLTLNLLLVLLDHLDGTEALVTKIVSEPVIAEQTGVDKEKMTAEIKSAFTTIRSNLPATRLQLTALIAEEQNNASLGAKVREMMGTATVETKVAKLASSKYWNQVRITLDNPSGKFPLKKASLDAEVTVDAGKAPVISAPAATVPFKVFNDTLPHTLVLEPDTDSATYDAGALPKQYIDVDMNNIGGYWFISTGSLPEHFKAQLKQEGTAYTLGGKALTSPATLQVVGDNTYIAVSAFRNAGITVTWDGQYRTLTLEN